MKIKLELKTITKNCSKHTLSLLAEEFNNCLTAHYFFKKQDGLNCLHNCLPHLLHIFNTYKARYKKDNIEIKHGCSLVNPRDIMPKPGDSDYMNAQDGRMFTFRNIINESMDECEKLAK